MDPTNVAPTATKQMTPAASKLFNSITTHLFSPSVDSIQMLAAGGDYHYQGRQDPSKP